MYFVSQTGQNDCAFTCLKILLANYHHDKNYLFLPSKRDAYSFKDLQDIARENHMEVIGVKRIENLQLRTSKDFPIIVTLNKSKGIRHSVLLLGTTRKYVKVFDPENGKRRILIEEFQKQWDQKALVVDKDAPKERYKCEHKVTDYIDKRDKITLPIWQLISSISLLVGMYFINSNSYFFVPIIFFAAFLIFEVLFRKNLISALKRMDENVFSYQMRVDKDEYFDVFKAYEKYRLVALSIIPNFIYTVLISVFVTLILIMNDAINTVYVVLSLVLAIIHVYVYLPYFHRKANEIAEQEQALNQAENQFQFKFVAEKAHDAAYQLGLNKNIFTYVELAVLLMSSITIMSISGIVNIIYVIFYLCISIYLKDNFIHLLEYSTQSEEFDSALAKLTNYFDLTVSNKSIE